jgi:hypothetical protein
MITNVLFQGSYYWTEVRSNGRRNILEGRVRMGIVAGIAFPISLFVSFLVSWHYSAAGIRGADWLVLQVVCLDELQNHPLDRPNPCIDALGLEFLYLDLGDIHLH